MGNGLLGLIVTAGLALAVIVLYRSMRKQMKKIDFDPDGTTDAERMRGTGKRKAAEPAADSEVNGYHEHPPQA